MTTTIVVVMVVGKTSLLPRLVFHHYWIDSIITSLATIMKRFRGGSTWRTFNHHLHNRMPHLHLNVHRPTIEQYEHVNINHRVFNSYPMQYFSMFILLVKGAAAATTAV